jgi:hypothetical protein
MKTASSRADLGELALLALGAAGILVASAVLIHRLREFRGVDWSSMS